MREAEDRHLPRPAALRVGVEVELVHHDLADVGARALAQRDVRQHLGRAADDRRPAVDRRVAGEHPHALRAEDAAQREELLRDERLDRRRVVGPAPLRERREVRGGGHQRLPGAGRRRQDHVVAAEELDHGLVLMRVERQPLLLRPAGERLVEPVGVRRVGNQVGQRRVPRHRHRVEYGGERQRRPPEPGGADVDVDVPGTYQRRGGARSDRGVDVTRGGRAASLRSRC